MAFAENASFLVICACYKLLTKHCYLAMHSIPAGHYIYAIVCNVAFLWFTPRSFDSASACVCKLLGYNVYTCLEQLALNYWTCNTVLSALLAPRVLYGNASLILGIHVA